MRVLIVTLPMFLIGCATLDRCPPGHERDQQTGECRIKHVNLRVMPTGCAGHAENLPHAPSRINGADTAYHMFLPGDCGQFRDSQSFSIEDMQPGEIRTIEDFLRDDLPAYGHRHPQGTSGPALSSQSVRLPALSLHTTTPPAAALGRSSLGCRFNFLARNPARKALNEDSKQDPPKPGLERGADTDPIKAGPFSVVNTDGGFKAVLIDSEGQPSAQQIRPASRWARIMPPQDNGNEIIFDRVQVTADGRAYSGGLVWKFGVKELPDPLPLWAGPDDHVAAYNAMTDEERAKVHGDYQEQYLEAVDEEMDPFSRHMLNWNEGRRGRTVRNWAGVGVAGVGGKWLYDELRKDSAPPVSRSLPTDGERATVIAETNAAIKIQDADQVPNIIASNTAVVDIDLDTTATIERNAGL